MTDTNEDGGRDDADLDALRSALGVARHLTNATIADRSVAVVQAEATLQLVAAVRDLTSLVALAVAPLHPQSTIASESDAEPVAGHNPAAAEHQGSAEPVQRRLCDVAEDLEPGDVVDLVDGSTIRVLAAGVSEGAAWFEVAGLTGDDLAAVQRVWVDMLARDERRVVDMSEAPGSVDLVTAPPFVDADDEGVDDVDVDGDDGWDDDDEA